MLLNGTHPMTDNHSDDDDGTWSEQGEEGEPEHGWTCFDCVGVDADLQQWPRRRFQVDLPGELQDRCHACFHQPPVLLARAPSRLQGGDPAALGGWATAPGATMLGATAQGSCRTRPGEPAAAAPVVPRAGPTADLPTAPPGIRPRRAAALGTTSTGAPALRDGPALRCVVCSIGPNWDPCGAWPDGFLGPLRTCSRCRDAWCSRGCFLVDATHRRTCGAYPLAAAAAATSRAGAGMAYYVSGWLGVD